MFTGAMLSIWLAGCALMPAVAPEESVQKRASQRWEHMLAAAWEKSYNMTAPSSRANNSFDKFRATIGANVKWRKVDVVSVKCEPEKCDARLQFEVDPPAIFKFNGTLSTGLNETWVQEEGQWWYLPR